MDNFAALKNELSVLMDKSKMVATKFGYATSAERIDEIKESLTQKELMILTVGEARRGKSTLLNAIIGEEKPIFPVDVNVCTNVVTVLRYGEEERVMVCIDDPEELDGVRTEFIDKSRIYEYVSEKGNPNNYRNVKALHISMPNEFLKSGIVLVDTPGVGSLNISHAEATYNYLPCADMVLFVSDVGAGYTETELNFMKKSYSYCKNIIFPVTKKDTSPDYQTIVDDNIEKISKTLEIPRDQIKIIPVSSNAKLRYLKNGKQAMYENSNFKALEDCMWSTVAKTKVELMLKPYAIDLKKELDKVYNGIVTQYNMLGEDSKKVSELMDTYEEENQRMKRYQEEGASWRTELNNYHLKGLSLSVDESMRNISTKATECLADNITNLEDKICKEENYTKVLSEINDIISMGTIEIREMICNSISEKVDEIKVKLGIHMDINEKIYEKIAFEGAGQIEVSFAKKKKANTVVTYGRNISLNASGGGMAGTILGAVIGGALGLCVGNPIAGATAGMGVGTSIGSVLGGAIGAADSLKYTQADINVVKSTISKYISESITKVKGLLSRANMEIVKEVNTALDKEIKKNISELHENIARIKANINTEKSDIPKKKDELKRQVKDIKTLGAMWENYTKKVSSVSFEKSNNVEGGQKAETPRMPARKKVVEETTVEQPKSMVLKENSETQVNHAEQQRVTQLQQEKNESQNREMPANEAIRNDKKEPEQKAERQKRIIKKTPIAKRQPRNEKDSGYGFM